MRVRVDGVEREVADGAVLGDVLGRGRAPGTDVAVRLSVERVRRTSSDFEIVMPEGTMALRLYDTPEAERFREHLEEIRGAGIRWITRSIVAFGSFPTDIPRSDEAGDYRENEVFFSLGGNDNRTTYLMVSRGRQRRAFGAGAGKIGRITVGRHLLGAVSEGERVLDVRPAVSEASRENVVVTCDPSYPLEDGCSVETRMTIRLDRGSPESAEQVLIAASKGYLNVHEDTGTFMGCRDGLDADVPVERIAVREAGSVCVRNEGLGEGHILVYKERRPLSPSLNVAGAVVGGMPLAARAARGGRVAVETDPPRILTVGMTQREAAEFLAGFGISQTRRGAEDDGAIVVEQTPEQTMAALGGGAAETFGVPAGEVHRITVTAEDEPTVRYFRRVTGLWHKPIGRLAVQFSFPGSPMATFEGDPSRAQGLTPQDVPFKKCRKGDIGVTNQSRPHHGLVGIRLQDSKQYGPTGEEPYGTNIVGRFEGDLSELETLDDGQYVYVTEMRI